MNVPLILAVIGGLLFILALVPQIDSRLGFLGGILLAVAVGLLATGVK